MLYYFLFFLLQAPRLEFEVASVRPAEAAAARVDVGTHIDGAQVRFTYLSLRDCVRIAYQVENHQIVGPSWIVEDHFNIAANIPLGAGQSQVREMLQNLLADRFDMKLHRESRDLPVYALTIGKSGLKLKETPPDAASESPAALDVTGTAGASGIYADMGNGAYFTLAENRLTGHKLPLRRITETLSRFMDKPVIDATGLSADKTFDISLQLTPEDFLSLQMRGALNSGINLPAEAAKMADSPLESLFSALQAEGLKLEARKAPLETIVIERATRTPTAN